MEDIENEKFVDAVMPRDTLAAPVNTPAKMASNIPFNFKPTIPTATESEDSMSDNKSVNKPDSVTVQSGASNVITGSVAPVTPGTTNEPNKRKREPFSPEAIFPTQPEKITISMDITAAEKAKMKEMKTPPWGEFFLETLTGRMDKLQTALGTNIEVQCKAVREECMKEIEEVKERCSEVESEAHDNSVSIKVLRDQLQKSRMQMVQNEVDNRAKRLIFAGFKEKKGETKEDLLTLVRDQIEKIENENYPNLKDCKIDRIYRDGRWRPDQKRPRDVKVFFSDYPERCAVLAGKKSFDSKIYCNADLPNELSHAQRTLKPIVDIVKGTPYGKDDRVTCIAGVLKVDKRKYGLHNIHTLPEGIQFWANNIRTTLFLMVWFGILSPFSNFFYSPMIIKKKEFLFAEQFIQWMKAMLFGDEYKAAEILLATDPYTCKRLGHQIKGFKQSEWDKEVPSVCDTVIRAKVEQNDFVRDFLIKSHPKILAEAAENTLWGCGVALKDDKVLKRKNWSQVGLGGMKYMEIRSELLGLSMPDLSIIQDSSDDEPELP